MGAQYILLELFGDPLIVTSCNVSGMPIITDDDEMFLSIFGEYTEPTSTPEGRRSVG